MPPKYQVLIDGTDYLQDVTNWKEFLPVIKRHDTYHSHIETFSASRLSLVKAAKTYVEGEKATRGAFASSTIQITRYNYKTDTYSNLVNGTLSYNDILQDKIEGTCEVKFHPDNPSEKVLQRDDQKADLHLLEDFDGEAITAFSSGPHNESYTLSLTKTEISGLAEVATSNCEIMLLWEIGVRLSQKILGRNDAFRSDLLGRTDGEVFQASSDGELSMIGLTNGGLVRAGTLSDYPMRISLSDYFGLINAITPIGLGIEYINNVPFIRIEKIDYFYDSTSEPIWTIIDPPRFLIQSNPSRVYGRVLSGYRKFEKANDAGVGESQSYIESMHTTRAYVTGLDSKSKATYNVRSNGIASPYLTEIVRNNAIANGNSDETDNDIFYIQVKRDGGGYIIDNDNVSTTGVLNPASQKNYLLTPGRTILNHLKIINAGLIIEYKNRESTESGFTGFSPIKLVEGVGNISASTRIGSETSEISENADLSAGVEPIYFEDDIILEDAIDEYGYITLRDNLKKRVKITYDGETHYGYIDQLNPRDLNNLEGTFKRANEDY